MMRRFSCTSCTRAASFLFGNYLSNHSNLAVPIANRPIAPCIQADSSIRFASTSAPTNSVNVKQTNPPNETKVIAADFKNYILKNRINKEIKIGQNIVIFIDSYYFAWVVMDRQDSSANSLNEAVINELIQAFEYIENSNKQNKDDKVKIVIVTSAKRNSFCVGADIDLIYKITDKNMSVQVPERAHLLFNRINNYFIPVVCAMNGMALGGGYELALACHYRVLNNEKSNFVGLPEVLLGVIPGAGGTVRLIKLCGLINAVKIIISGQRVNPTNAKKKGLIDYLIPGTNRYENEFRFFQGVRRLAGTLMDKPHLKKDPKKLKIKLPFHERLLQNTRIGRKIIVNNTLKELNKKTKGKYISPYRALESVLYAATHDEKHAILKEQEIFSQLLITPEAKNLMALFFLDEHAKKIEKQIDYYNKNKNEIHNNHGRDIIKKKDDIKKVTKAGVIGAGVMGSGIVHYFIKNNIPVALKDLSDESIKKGLAFIRKEIENEEKKKNKKLVTDKNNKKGGPSPLDKLVDQKMALVTAGTDDAVLKGCDVIVEAAVERMDLKKKIISDLESKNILTEKTIFATNTSSLSIDEMQKNAKYPENILGMHFFNPVKKMPLIEIIKGHKTCINNVFIIYLFSLLLKKKPIIVNDGPGFLVNRVLAVYMAEAGRLAIQKKISMKRIDTVLLNFGMPMGPFRLLDEVGLDVACHVGPVLEEGLESKNANANNSRFHIPKNIQQMVKDGYLGKKNNKGFYFYNEKGHDTGVNTAVEAKYLKHNMDEEANKGNAKSTNESISDQEILNRCVFLMINEASMILQEKKVNDNNIVDIGMVWGTGFPPFRGGLLQHADHYGIKNIVKEMEDIKKKNNNLDYFTPCALLTDMAKTEKRFFPDRPYLPYKERTGFPKVPVY